MFRIPLTFLVVDSVSLSLLVFATLLFSPVTSKLAETKCQSVIAALHSDLQLKGRIVVGGIDRLELMQGTSLPVALQQHPLFSGFSFPLFNCFQSCSLFQLLSLCQCFFFGSWNTCIAQASPTNCWGTNIFYRNTPLGWVELSWCSMAFNASTAARITTRHGWRWLNW